MQDRHVYIIIVNYLQWQDSKDCIASLLRSTYKNFSLFVIDNNSRNNSLEHLYEWIGSEDAKKVLPEMDSGSVCTNYARNDIPADHSKLPFITLVQNERNVGFAAANNIVLDLLKGKDAFIWMLNPDMVVREDTLAELVSFTSLQHGPCVVGAVVRNFAGNQELLFYGGGSVRFSSATVRPLTNKLLTAKLDYISGACLFTHASAFEEHGLLPEKYFLYWEETDWCYQAKKQGMPLLYCEMAVCYDKISTVIGKNFLANYYYCRNGLQFVSKYRKVLLPFAFGSAVLRFFKRVLTGQWGRARGVFRGMVDFLKGKANEIQ